MTEEQNARANAAHAMTTRPLPDIEGCTNMGDSYIVSPYASPETIAKVKKALGYPVNPPETAP